MEKGKGRETKGKQYVSLFVENIPERMQSKGLWHFFARHGEVVATFIARKLSRGGKRFGFVRFRDEVDAGRAMERLNDFVVYWFRLIVKLANQKVYNADLNQRKVESKLEGSSESSSELVRGSQVVEDEQSDEVEKAAINDVFFGKEFAVSRGQDLGITERHIGEADLMGDFNSYEALKSGGDFTKGIFPGAKFQETENLREDGDHVEKRDPCVVIKKTQLVDSDSPSFKATEDLLNKGLSQALVDKEFGSKVASEGDSVTKGQAQGALVEGDTSRVELPRKLQKLKLALKEWNKNSCGNIDQRIKKLELELVKLEEDGNWSDEAVVEWRLQTLKQTKMKLWDLLRGGGLLGMRLHQWRSSSDSVFLFLFQVD
ncbi:hypothetical protein V6N11_036591 [Hibiscus sabdariffa]|uniref:RRM domain-containing protein n=1 Tax=Hibiscus sabdariffa TaxID=183260 RepID=A0ABR2RBE8_9ROSI